MQGGIFLVLCFLALLMGSKARNLKFKGLSEKEIRRKYRIKRLMIWLSLGVCGAVILAYTPFLIEEISIARDTQFTLETYLSMLIFVFGWVTIYTIMRSLKKKKQG